MPEHFYNGKEAEILIDYIDDYRLDNIKKVATEVKRHFIPVGELVKTPASLKYKDYNLMWNRDSAYSSYYITRFIENSRKSSLDKILGEDIAELKDLNAKLINTLWEALDHEVKKIRMNGYEKDISKLESKLGGNHILSRFDVDENGVKRATNDVNEGKTTRSWTMQYDSAPLIIMATEEYVRNFGTEGINGSVKKIKNDLDFITRYMYNFYNTPCADAWEQYYFYERENTQNGQIYVGKTIDSYTVSSVYRGIKGAKNLAGLLGITLGDADEKEIASFILSNFIATDEKRGEFLAKSKIEYGESMLGVGAEEIEIFNTFKPEGLEKYERNTVDIIKNELFQGDPLPIRYRFFGKYRGTLDKYFGRGAWFHLGLQYAMYLADRGMNEQANQIINYVEQRINSDGSIPEQEISEKKRIEDPDRFFEKNGNSTISCLLWAETAYLAAATLL